MGRIKCMRSLLVVAIACLSVESRTGERDENQHGDMRCTSEHYCRCPQREMLVNDSCIDLCLTSLEETSRYRCAKCDERKKEERAKLAQTIIVNVAQFFQGMVTLANSGKEADDKLKAEQCLLMAQAVGNLIYQAHEHHRYDSMGNDINKGALSLQRKSVLVEKLYEHIRHIMDDHVLLSSCVDSNRTSKN